MTLAAHQVCGGRALIGRITVPGDKSIGHRALLLAAIAEGVSRVRGLPEGGDLAATARLLESLGVGVTRDGDELVVIGRGLQGLRAPREPLDCGGSGTTLRLAAGLLAGQRFASVLTGNAQLCGRPMERIAVPLRAMGADVVTSSGCAPVHLAPASLRGIRYALPVASAQVKSCVLLAGLCAEGTTETVEPAPTRDHTERMLAAMGAPLERDGALARIRRPETLAPLDLVVPGDPSSAAFLLVAAACSPGSAVRVDGVCANPTRTGIVDALRRMGALVQIHPQSERCGEPVADLEVRSAPLHGINVGGAAIPSLIDELPVLAVAATQASGTTEIGDAGELRVKETDRIAATAAQLRLMGAHIEERPDGLRIEGPTPLRGAEVDSCGDHRLAMALGVASALASGTTHIRGADVCADSFPGFFEVLDALREGA